MSDKQKQRWIEFKEVADTIKAMSKAMEESKK